MPGILAMGPIKLKLTKSKVVFNAQFHDQNNVYCEVLGMSMHGYFFSTRDSVWLNTKTMATVIFPKGSFLSKNVKERAFYSNRVCKFRAEIVNCIS